jgi:hypothetical protein
MNKAFVREPDPPDPRCPRCGVLGEGVGRATLAEHLPLEAVALLSESACFCANPRCDAAYYDASGASVGVGSLRKPVYPKDPSAPVCACFGATADAIERDARAGVTAGVKLLIAKSQSPAAECSRKAANGRCCVPEVQRIFIRAQRPAVRK